MMTLRGKLRRHRPRVLLCRRVSDPLRTGGTYAVQVTSERRAGSSELPVPAYSEPKEINRSRAHLRDQCCNLAIKSWRRGRIKSGIAAGATAPALGLAQ